MKKLLFLLLMFMTVINISAQEKKEEETAKPTYGVKVERKIDFLLLNGVEYENVMVELDAADIDSWTSSGVKVTIRDGYTNKKIYKERFSKSYLYAFSNGSIQVGKGYALLQVLIVKTEDTGKWVMELREKGIY